jgi:hypothetical protein
LGLGLNEPFEFAADHGLEGITVGGLDTGDVFVYPWCTSQSKTSTRSAPIALAFAAAAATLLKMQKPIAVFLGA